MPMIRRGEYWWTLIGTLNYTVTKANKNIIIKGKWDVQGWPLTILNNGFGERGGEEGERGLG